MLRSPPKVKKRCFNETISLSFNHQAKNDQRRLTRSEMALYRIPNSSFSARVEFKIVSTRFNSSFRKRFSSASCAALGVLIRTRLELDNAERSGSADGVLILLFKKISCVRARIEVLRLSSSSSSSRESTSSRR